MNISSQLHNYGGKGWMYCISGGTSCGLPRRFSSEGLSFWRSEEKMVDFRFCIVSGAFRVSL